jgi:hypothetical protein
MGNHFETKIFVFPEIAWEGISTIQKFSTKKAALISNMGKRNHFCENILMA